MCTIAARPDLQDSGAPFCQYPTSAKAISACSLKVTAVLSVSDSKRLLNVPSRNDFLLCWRHIFAGISSLAVFLKILPTCLLGVCC